MIFKSLCVVGIFLFCGMPLYAQDVSITDFRIPESQYQRLLGNLSGAFSQTSDTIAGNRRYLFRNNFVNAGVNYLYGSQSEDYNFIADVDASTSYRSGSDNFWNNLYRREKNEGSELNGSILYQQYIVPDRFFGFSAFTTQARYSYSKNIFDSTGQHHHTEFFKNRQGNVLIGAGVGIGKMREASSVFFVIRIIERLKELNVFQRELTKEEILELVSTFAKKMEYTVNYERFTKYYFGELLEILANKGVLKTSSLTPYEVLYALDVQYEQVYLRWFGWSISLGGYVSKNQNEEISSNLTMPKRFNKQDVNSVRLNAEFGYPLTNSFHLYTKLIFDAPVLSKQKKVDIDFFCQPSYELTEKISTNFTIHYSKNNGFTYYYPSSYPEAFYTQAYLTLSWNFQFYIENNISFYTMMMYVDSKYESEVNGNTTMNQRVMPTISFGINYRFF